MGDFLMPSLGADMDSGTVIEWRVAVGDTVHRGDIMAVVDTDKSDIEVEVFEDGVVEALLVDIGADVPVGTPLARIRSPRPVAAPAEPVAPSARPEPVSRQPSGGDRRADRHAAPKGTRVLASPLARRRAQELDVDLTELVGSGPGGAIELDDVVHATPEPSGVDAPTPEGEDRAARRSATMRRAIGDLMARSSREIPHYHLATTVDLQAALDWLRARNADRPVADRVLPAALLLTATARAAARCPAMNGVWEDGFRPAPAVHLGVAVGLRGGGLVAPAIHDADKLSLDQMMAALTDLVARARGGRLRAAEMADGTITVTNLGERGADEVFGVIYPPQVALVGFGRIVERPWASGGMVGARPTVRVSLAADHRASDGHEGSRMLATIDHQLQRPADLT
jgi:pyruvate dehydrogenase E2 component (dihydrolipoamide acetyltransferase)